MVKPEFELLYIYHNKNSWITKFPDIFPVEKMCYLKSNASHTDKLCSILSHFLSFLLQEKKESRGVDWK